MKSRYSSGPSKLAFTAMDASKKSSSTGDGGGQQKSGKAPKSAKRAARPAGKDGKDAVKSGLSKSAKSASGTGSSKGKATGGKQVQGAKLESKGDGANKKPGQSPPSTVQTGSPTTGDVPASPSISAVTESSVLGKVRVPTLIVNPADIPTTRTIGAVSDKSWANRTIGGRKGPSASLKKENQEKQQQRTRRTILISTVASVAVLLLLVVVIMAVWFSLSKPPAMSVPNAKLPLNNDMKRAWW